MPIINLNQNTPLTNDQILQRQADSYCNQINTLYSQIVGVSKQITHFIWDNTSKAQDRFDLFGPSGTNAGSLCHLAGLFNYLITDITGSGISIIPSGFSVTPQNNGTVIVSGV